MDGLEYKKKESNLNKLEKISNKLITHLTNLMIIPEFNKNHNKNF